MVHQDKPDSAPQIKQVEFNTIAASFGGLSSQTSHLHKYGNPLFPLLPLSLPFTLDAIHP
jgi:glutathione synthase